ncbi:MAG: hypothetical protein GY856_46590 [bacterium]|nr:hypothetical protein [bacterium]
MSREFTDYVRSLNPAGDPPDAMSFERLWEVLRAALRREVKRRGLWESPPSYLGVYGWGSWQMPERIRAGAERSPASRQSDALDELVADCYSYVFITRLRSLRRLAGVNPSIDGVVVRSIRNFLHDTQRSQDPLGFRIFKVLRAALKRLLDRGRLHILSDGPKIANETIFGSRAEAEPSSAEGVELHEPVRTWNDALLPELVTARGEEEGAVVEELANRLAELPAQGIGVFRFRDLIDPLKADVRARWAALFEWTEGETGLEEGEDELVKVVRLLQPDTGVEDRDAFRALAAAVEDELERLEVRKGTRRHLTTLWQFLRTFAAEGVEDQPPSHRKLSALLGIPRDRFAGLYATLREVIERCNPSNPARRTVSSSRRGVLSFGPRR